VDEDELNE